MSKKIKLKFQVGDYVFTPKGAGIVKGFNITCSKSIFLLEYEIERSSSSLARDFSKIIYVEEHKVFKSIKDLMKYGSYEYRGNYKSVIDCLSNNYKDMSNYENDPTVKKNLKIMHRYIYISKEDLKNE